MKYFIIIGCLALLSVIFYFNKPDNNLPQIKESKPKMVLLEKASTPVKATPQIQQVKDLTADLKQDLNFLAGCQEHDRCPFEDSDPKAIYFAVGDAIQNKLSAFRNVADSDQIIKIAQKFMLFEHDGVKITALDLIAAQPPQKNSLPIIIEGIRWSVDPSLYEAALIEFSRYQSAESRETVTDFLIETIKTGPVFARRAVVNVLLPLLTMNNIQKFTHLSHALAVNSVEAKNLKAVLSVYQQAHHHGNL